MIVLLLNDCVHISVYHCRISTPKVTDLFNNSIAPVYTEHQVHKACNFGKNSALSVKFIQFIIMNDLLNARRLPGAVITRTLKIGLILNDLNKSLKAMKTCFARRQNMYNLVRVTFLVSLSSSYNYPLSRKSLNGIDINTAL